MESDASYFQRRADEETAMARSAACELARASHQQMAERYSQLAAAIMAVDEQIGPVEMGRRFPAAF